MSVCHSVSESAVLCGGMGGADAQIRQGPRAAVAAGVAAVVSCPHGFLFLRLVHSHSAKRQGAGRCPISPEQC